MKRIGAYGGWLIIIATFLIGFWLIVIRPLGPGLSQLPGDLGDARFNNYILEHDFRWITGKDASLLDAPFFYPYPQTLTFSDNHFGSMLFYDAFRWSGLNREDAFQAWYLLSYLLSFGAAAYVLKKINLKPLAVSIGAFFFTFGLPVLAQENHVQLFYRFCIPLACYTVWRFSQEHRFKQLVLTAFWLVWQFYLSIYLGYFLSLLLVSAAIGMPFLLKRKAAGYLFFWPRVIRDAWGNSRARSNYLSLALVSTLVFSLVILFSPYVQATREYGFTRLWSEVLRMLPRVQSYFISDGSPLWKPMAFLSENVTGLRWEHQLFIGVPALILLAGGLIWHLPSANRRMAFLFIGAAAFLVLITLEVKGFSLYRIIWSLPGFTSIRAVTRIILVLIWPIALFISIEVDAFLSIPGRAFMVTTIAVVFLGFMMAESALYQHATFAKSEADARLQKLEEKIPANLPQSPVLFVWNPDDQTGYLTELDAMLLAQDLGWPVMNGYSGNIPGGYGASTDCSQVVDRISRYMSFAHISDPNFYQELISRVVSIGPEACQWPDEMP